VRPMVWQCWWMLLQYVDYMWGGSQLASAGGGGVSLRGGPTKGAFSHAATSSQKNDKM